MILIVEASYSDSSRDGANFYSTLTANLSALVILGGNNISCGSYGTGSTTGLDFQYIGKLATIINNGGPSKYILQHLPHILCWNVPLSSPPEMYHCCLPPFPLEIT